MIMKRNLLLAIATLLLAGSSATAQDWKEALKKPPRPPQTRPPTAS
ncbi:MAG: hypothetical protein ACLSCF_10850 [Alistipes finegoldii]